MFHSLKRRLEGKRKTIDQVAGFTGFGWTASLLGYLGLVVGYTDTPITDPQSLLYLGCALFVATLGLDRLTSVLSNGGT